MLTNFVSIYVPNTQGTNGIVNSDKRARILDDTARQLSNAFGGATAQDATGYYVSEAGELVTETVTIVKAYHDKDAQDAQDIARNIAGWIKTTLQQEAVTIETNQGMEFI